MSQPFVFIGDSNSWSKIFSTRIKEAGFTPVDLKVTKDLRHILASAPPVAVIFDNAIEDRNHLIASLRESSALTETPFLARIPHIDSEMLRDGFRDGMGDYILDDATHQFAALLEILNKDTSWRAVRAGGPVPAGPPPGPSRAARPGPATESPR